MDAIQHAGLGEQARGLIAQYRAATLALRERAGQPEVHGYRLAARRLLALLALWRPLIYQPGLERRLKRAIGSLSALRDAQVYAERFGAGTASAGKERVRVPMLTVRLDRWLDQLSRVPAFDPLPLYQMQMGLRLADGLAQPEPDPPADDKQQLRYWHRLRLILKQVRYGVELLLDREVGDPAWLALLIRWQEQLGQLQDGRQWLKRLRREKTTAKRQRQQRRLGKKMRRQLQQLDCQQAELVGFRMALLGSPVEESGTPAQGG